MREKINRLAQGNIDSSTPIVFVEPDSVEYELAPDHSVRMELLITSGNDVHVKGLAYSSDIRVRILNPSFGGSNVRLVFEVMFRSTDDEDTFSGKIILVTNGGEFNIPYRFHKKDAAEDQELSCLGTIDDFAHMAVENKNNALRVFEMSNFTKAPFMQSIRMHKLYSEFRKCPDREIAMEQFIASAGVRISNYSEDSEAFCRSNNAVKKPNNDFRIIDLESSDTYRRHYYEYSRRRLAYDMDRGNKEEIIEEMIYHLNAIKSTSFKSEYITLLKAEAEFLKGNVRETLMLMNSVSSVIRDNRQEMFHEYFLLEYLEIIVNHRDRASFIRLCRKFIEEQHFNDLFIFVIKLDDELMSNDILLRNFLTEVFSYGCRSPWLYYYYCMLLNDHPEYLYAPKSIDSHSLNFGRKYHVISENISQAVISASCTAYIKSDRKLISAHKTYSEGIELDLNINGLYEYYLYSLPNDPDYVIIDKVLEHYRVGDRLDAATKARLYSNIVKNKKKTTSIYKAYEERIIQFTLSQLREQNASDQLLELYINVLRPDMINQELSEQFLKLVHCYRIRTSNPEIRSVVITYAQASDESLIAVKDGIAVLPVYYPNSIILFQDTYGNRYYDVPYTKEQLFTQNSFRNTAEKMCPSNSVTRIKRTNDLMMKKALNGDDILHLENEVYEKDLNDESKALIISRLIQYYNQHAATGYNPEFLLRINKLSLSTEERRDLCNAYITCGCFTQAYEMVREFGVSGITDKNIRALCSNMIIQEQSNEDPLLISLCEYAVKNGNTDTVILDYLCRYYNGPTDIMYEILKKAISSHQDTYDMEERLIAQLIFTGDNTRIDRVFDWYVTRRQASESIARAYFTIKTTSYFFDSETIDSKIFDYLENAVRDVAEISNVPLIYILALTKHYSQIDNLSESRIELAQKLVTYLLDKKFTFKYLKKFNSLFQLPGDFMCRQVISYKLTPGKMILFRSRVEPAEKEFRAESADKSFMSLFIKTKVLFAGETWHYEVYESDVSGSRMIDKGTLRFEDSEQELQNSKFRELNDICSEFTKGNDSNVISLMNGYASKEVAFSRLFDIQ